MDRGGSFLLGVVAGILVTLGVQKWVSNHPEGFGEIGETIEEHLAKLEQDAGLANA